MIAASGCRVPAAPSLLLPPGAIAPSMLVKAKVRAGLATQPVPFSVKMGGFWHCLLSFSLFLCFASARRCFLWRPGILGHTMFPVLLLPISLWFLLGGFLTTIPSCVSGAGVAETLEQSPP